MSSSFDLAVLGAGIAGVSVAWEAARRNLSVLLIDTHDIAAGASGTPAGLLNPATGRFAKLSWNAVPCFEQTAALIEEAFEGAPTKDHPTRGILRPALDVEIAEGMKENLQADNWPDGWAEWLSPDQLSEIHPGINSEFGALSIPKGFGLDIGAMLHKLCQKMPTALVTTLTSANYELRQDGKQWMVTTEEERYCADRMVVTSGVASTEHSEWADLPLHPVKGQIAIFETDQPHGILHALSSLGYYVPVSERHIGVGSTYEHHFESAEPDATGAQALEEKLTATLPFLEGKVSLVHQWAGVRASTPNYKPFVGPHPELAGMYVLAGLGSKGLLYGPFAAQCLVEAIVEEDYSLIPNLLHVKRAYRKMGY